MSQIYLDMILHDFPVEETFEFNEGYIKIYNGDSDIGFFTEAYVHRLENLHSLHNGIPSLLERMRIEELLEKLVKEKKLKTKSKNLKKLKNLRQTCMINKIILFT